MNGIDRFYDLSGLWEADIGDGRIYPMRLPGTLDENCIGHKDICGKAVHPDETLGGREKESAPEDGGAEASDSARLECPDAPIATRFTRKYTYEGAARFTRSFTFGAPAGKRVFLEVERARCLRLLVDDREVPAFGEATLCTPHVFEVTGLPDGTHKVTLVSDNSYPGLPHDAIVYSSAATDETQTNWNGALGYLRLRTEEPVFPASVRVYPKGDRLTVRIVICADESWSGTVTVRSEALREGMAEATVQIDKQERTGNMKMTSMSERASISDDGEGLEIGFFSLALREDIKRWDEAEGNLYELSVTLSNGASKTVVFGVRDFGAGENGRLTINGRTFFLRGEANCAVFPETGYPPMTRDAWREILLLYRSYGINCVRFHSHCPPDAAFTAADELGMMMQPELSHWNPKDAFESEESYLYYRAELRGILVIDRKSVV